MNPESSSFGHHYQWLDLLRFLSAAAVVACHARYFLFASYSSLTPSSRGALTAVFFSVTALGHDAVVVFFVLSGYLVGGKAIERMISETFDCESYAIDRLTRILVPLIPCLALSAVIEHLAIGERYGALSWIGNLLGLQNVAVLPLANNVPLWSLAYEIWFYIIVYAVGRLVMRSAVDLRALILITCSALVFSKLAVHYLACWLVGAVFYLKPWRAKPALGLLSAIALSGGAVVGRQVTVAGLNSFNQGLPAAAVLWDLLLATGTGVLCVVLVSVPHMRLSAWGVHLAAFSYSLYLTHYPILRILELRGWQRISHIDASAYVCFAMAFVVCLLSAWIIYFVSERNTRFVRTYTKSVLSRIRSQNLDSHRERINMSVTD